MIRIGIIGGKGRMGSAMALFLREQGHDVVISDRKTSLTNTALAKQCDIVIVSVNIEKTKEVIDAIAPHLKKSALLMDLTSIKEIPVQAMQRAKCAVIGLHPMCNATTFGAGQTMLYAPVRPGKWLPWAKETFEKKGGFKWVKVAPKKHDEQMALVQGLVHFMEIVLGKTLAELSPNLDELLTFASPSSQLQFKIAARHLVQDPNLYGNIQIQNPRNVKVVSTYQKAAQELCRIVEKRDMKAFTNYFNAGKKYFGPFGEKALQETDGMIQRMLNIKPSQRSGPIPKDGIACLGPAFTFSSLAAEKWRGVRKNPFVYLGTIEEVIEAVASGKVREGVVPIENRLYGTVRETMDGLFTHTVSIVGEFKLPIHHTLAMLKGVKTSEIRSVISHPQALNQCSHYLKKHLPHAEWLNAPSTAAAFEYVAKHCDRSIAAIGPREGAQHFGLQASLPHIENDRANETRFIAIQKDAPKLLLANGAKTSVIFYFSKNRPGSLFAIFKIFADLNVNLSRIESRPAPKELGEYLFYLDFEAGAGSPKGKRALTAVEPLVDGLKILGSYKLA